MVIKNKSDGYRKRQEMNLNRFPENVFCKSQVFDVKSFVAKYDVDYYAIRSLDVIGYKSKIKVPKDPIWDEINNHERFTFSVSSHNYTENLMLIGDIMIGKDSTVWLLASKKVYPKLSCENPDFNLSTDLFDKRLNRVPGFDIIFKYIVDNNLLDIIVEFAIYDKSVGIHHEQVVVFEIRTDY